MSKLEQALRATVRKVDPDGPYARAQLYEQILQRLKTHIDSGKAQPGILEDAAEILADIERDLAAQEAGNDSRHVANARHLHADPVDTPSDTQHNTGEMDTGTTTARAAPHTSAAPWWHPYLTMRTLTRIGVVAALIVVSLTILAMKFGGDDTIWVANLSNDINGNRRNRITETADGIVQLTSTLENARPVGRRIRTASLDIPDDIVETITGRTVIVEIEARATASNGSDEFAAALAVGRNREGEWQRFTTGPNFTTFSFMKEIPEAGRNPHDIRLALWADTSAGGGQLEIRHIAMVKGR